jgi:hypothetical protein
MNTTNSLILVQLILHLLLSRAQTLAALKIRRLMVCRQPPVVEMGMRNQCQEMKMRKIEMIGITEIEGNTNLKLCVISEMNYGMSVVICIIDS